MTFLKKAQTRYVEASYAEAGYSGKLWLAHGENGRNLSLSSMFFL